MKEVLLNSPGTKIDTGGIDYLGIDRVLKRGSGEIIANQNDALLIRDSVSEAYFLACDDETIGMMLLDRHIGHDCDLLMVSNSNIGKAAFDRHRFTKILECYQVAFYGKKPSTDTRLSIRTADEHDLKMLIENYQMISQEELEKVVRRGSILLGYYQGCLIGFIGEHLEGSMGILYVFPEYRNKGFGMALETHLIAKTMENGYIPFAQIEKGNQASLKLQDKIGMTKSENLITWMWK